MPSSCRVSHPSSSRAKQPAVSGFAKQWSMPNAWQASGSGSAEIETNSAARAGGWWASRARLDLLCCSLNLATRGNVQCYRAGVIPSMRIERVANGERGAGRRVAEQAHQAVYHEQRA